MLQKPRKAYNAEEVEQVYEDFQEGVEEVMYSTYVVPSMPVVLEAIQAMLFRFQPLVLKVTDYWKSYTSQSKEDLEDLLEYTAAEVQAVKRNDDDSGNTTLRIVRGVHEEGEAEDKNKQEGEAEAKVAKQGAKESPPEPKSPTGKRQQKNTSASTTCRENARGVNAAGSNMRMAQGKRQYGELEKKSCSNSKRRWESCSKCWKRKV